MDDANILALFLARNEDAIAESQKKYGQVCCKLAQNLLGSPEDAKEAVNAFLDSLPPSDRRVFLRRYWYFDEVKSIAARFGYSESKVKMILKRRRDQLAEKLKKEGYII